MGAFENLEDEQLANALTSTLQNCVNDSHLMVVVGDWNECQTPTNGGIQRSKVLAGNIGYLDIREFPHGDNFITHVQNALHKISHTRALIIDLRSNSGGSPFTAQYYLDHLLPADRDVMDFHWLDENRTEHFRTREPPSERQFGTAKPISVLTSKETVSAGEQLAYDLQAHRRATLIGETTMGGANPSKGYSIGTGFELSIPVGRVINAITKTNWQYCGVKPDVLINARAAFKVAYRILIGAGS